jgi:hypothetical protein
MIKNITKVNGKFKILFYYYLNLFYLTAIIFKEIR